MQLEKSGLQFSIWTGKTAQLIHRLTFLILEPDENQRQQQKHLEASSQKHSPVKYQASGDNSNFHVGAKL